MEALFTLSPIVVAAAPLTIGLVQVVKHLGLGGKFAPLASILIGIGLVALTGVEWQVFLVQGLIVGLVASGLWSGTKTLVQS